MTTKQYRILAVGVAALLALLLDVSSLGHSERRLEVSELRALYQRDRRLHIARNHKFVYIHIPKSGGSTVEESILFDEKRSLGIGPRSHHPVVVFKDAANLTDDFTYATHIRDPCERFVSAFMYLRHDKRSRGMRGLSISHGLFESETAEEFVHSLDETSWHKLKGSILHFNPMSKYLIHHDTDEFGMDVVMCQEQWNEGVNRLADALELDAVPSSLLARKRQNTLNKASSCASMHQNVAALIMEQYALDACLFGYGAYGQGNYTIAGRNESLCIGAQFDRDWFTERLKFCRNSLTPSE